MNKLIIDTADNKNVFARLDTPNGEFVARSDSKSQRPDSIVNLIEEVLKKGDVGLREIDEINVNKGPGSYTGLKVGVSVANALSFALDRKVNDKEIGQLVDPSYE